MFRKKGNGNIITYFGSNSFFAYFIYNKLQSRSRAPDWSKRQTWWEWEEIAGDLWTVILLKSLPGQGPPLSFFPSSPCFAPSEFWLGSIAGLEPGVFCSASALRCVYEGASLGCAQNPEFQGSRYQDGAALPVRIQCSRKFTNSPFNLGHSSHTYHPAMKGPRGCLCFFSLHAPKPLTGNLSFCYSICETDQSWAWPISVPLRRPSVCESVRREGARIPCTGIVRRRSCQEGRQ